MFHSKNVDIESDLPYNNSVDGGKTVHRCVEAPDRFSFGPVWSIVLGVTLPQAG